MPQYPEPIPDVDARRRESRQTIGVALFFVGVIGFLILMVSLGKALRKPPVERVVAAEGYELHYYTYIPSREDWDWVTAYLGMGQDGRCYQRGYPLMLDEPICKLRLRQIEAMDCAAGKPYDDKVCDDLLSALGEEDAGKRRVSMQFLVSNDIAKDVRVLSDRPAFAEEVASRGRQ